MTEMELLTIHKNNILLGKLKNRYTELLCASLIPAKQFDGMPGGGRSKNSTMEPVEERRDIEEEYKCLYAANNLLIKRARKYIGQFPDQTLRMILAHRYINGMELSDVAAAVGITTFQCSEILRVHWNNIF